MRGLKVLLGLDGKTSPTDGKRGTATRNSRCKNNTKCPSGTTGSGTNKPPKRTVVTRGKENPRSKPAPTSTPSGRKSPKGELYMTASGGSDGMPAINVGETVGKLFNANPTPTGNDGGKSKMPDTKSYDQRNEAKGKTSGAFKVEIGVKKNGIKKPIIDLGKKKGK